MAAISVAPSDFQNVFEVATGTCKTEGNLAGGHFLSSLFSLLSFLCSLPSSLFGAEPFPPLPAPLGTSFGTSRGLIWGSLAAFFGISSLFSLLSSRFSLRSSLFSLLSPPVSLLSSLSALFPLLSSLSALFPLLSLLLISQIALRTSHFELCIRPSLPLPIHSTLCLTIPGPAECAKRLNNNNDRRLGGENGVTPTGKSFRFVRACVRARRSCVGGRENLSLRS